MNWGEVSEKSSSLGQSVGFDIRLNAGALENQRKKGRASGIGGRGPVGKRYGIGRLGEGWQRMLRETVSDGRKTGKKG